MHSMIRYRCYLGLYYDRGLLWIVLFGELLWGLFLMSATYKILLIITSTSEVKSGLSRKMRSGFLRYLSLYALISYS